MPIIGPRFGMYHTSPLNGSSPCATAICASAKRSPGCNLEPPGNISLIRSSTCFNCCLSGSNANAFPIPPPLCAFCGAIVVRPLHIVAAHRLHERDLVVTQPAHVRLKLARLLSRQHTRSLKRRAHLCAHVVCVA